MSSSPASDFREAIAIDALSRRLERNRIRTELIDWLVGDQSINPPMINGRRIIDEIDRICPKE